MPGGYYRNSGTWGSPDAVKVGPPHVGPPRRHSRPRHKTGGWAPICPAATRRTRHRQPRQRTGGPPGPPSTRKKTWRSRGPRRPAGGQAHSREPTSTRTEKMSPGWKLPEDLGAKKMEAPWGAGTEKLSVSVRPPGKGGRPHLTPSEEYLDERKPRRLIRRIQRGFPAKTPPSPRAHLWYPLGL